ncbi:MAG: hypothetical protein HGA66_15155, partial [Holophaga sp.]|nr:hypothetical protein [Holophaga sp.]
MRLALYLPLALALGAQVPAPPTAKDMAGHVESARLRRTVERLAAFGTRHSLSKSSTEAHGIVAARNWLIGETRNLAMLPGSRLIPFEDRFV